MPNILVIDDEHSIRESFSLILEGLYNVTLAASGEAGLKAVSSQKQDLVFLDCRMPGMNGLETLKRIKEIDSKPEVIMVTAVNDMQSAGEAIRLGARDYIGANVLDGKNPYWIAAFVHKADIPPLP